MVEAADSKRPREKITLETVIPAMPTKSQRLKKPDSQAYENEVKELDEIIARAEEKLEAFRAQIQAKREGGTVNEAKMSSKAYLEQLYSQRGELNNEAGRLRAERETLYLKFNELKDEQTRIKPRIKFFDEHEINIHIRNLQEKQEHTSLSLNEEKRVVAEIRELELSKPLVAQYHERQGVIEKLQTDLKAVKTKLADVVAKAQDANGKITEINSQLKESYDKHKSEIPILVEQRKDLQAKIDEYKAKKAELLKKQRVEEHDYTEQQNLIKHIEFATSLQKRLREQEERKKFAEERKKEEDENRPHPFGTEIAKCDGFIQYLERLLPKQAESEGEHKPVLGEVEEGMVITLDKKERGQQQSAEWFGGAVSKQKKKRERKPAGVAAVPVIQISVDMLSFLAAQGIKVPSGVEDLPATIKEIKDRREAYARTEVKPAPVKEERKREVQDSPKKDKELDFPEPKNSEVVVTHGLFLAEEAEERKDRPATAPVSKARGSRGSRGPRGDRGRGGRRGRAPRGERPVREVPEPTAEESAD